MTGVLLRRGTFRHRDRNPQGGCHATIEAEVEGSRCEPKSPMGSRPPPDTERGKERFLWS